jgi:Rrf2 family protein
MRISTRLQFGLRILCQLALARNARPLQLGEIGEREGISEKYLGQIMLGLRSGKLVDAVRGSQGGYFLARPPASISVLDLVTSLDRELLELDEGSEDGSASGSTRGASSEAWKRLRVAMEESLRAITLEELARDVEARRGTSDFTI